MKINCWEYMRCGREPGGSRATESGPCPAAMETRLHGKNGGENGGRACWVVPGTLGGNAVQGKFVHKRKHCLECPFYQLVHGEEMEMACSTMKLFECIMDMHADIR